MAKRKDQEKFSFSKIDTYESCGFKYKLRYIEGPYVSGNSIALELGTLIHETEENIANDIKYNRPINYIQYKNKIIVKMYELQHKYPIEYAEADKAGRYYKDKVKEYLTKGIYRLEMYLIMHPELEIVGCEVFFNFKYKDTRLTGKIDRVLRNKETGNYICQDIKTYPEPVAKENLATPLQFVIYTLAMKEKYGILSEQISCSYDLPFCDIIQPAGTSGYMTRGIKKLDSLLDNIDAEEFAPKPTPLCHWCEYCPTNSNQPEECKGRCPYYCKWTKENKTFQKQHEWEGVENHSRILELFQKELGITVQRGDQ